VDFLDLFDSSPTFYPFAAKNGAGLEKEEK